MSFVIQKAEKTQSKARIGLVGPAGSGKTYTSLLIAREIAQGGKVVLIDTENYSASKYADEYDFDVLPLDPPYSPQRYTEAIKFCDEQGYAVIIIDSLSHAWSGEGGALEMVDNIKVRSRSGNAFAAWRDVTPAHNRLIEAMLRAKAHIIGTMRAKTEYVQEKDDRGKTNIRKVGMAPIQREGMDYEFDIVLDLDWENRAMVSKTRCRDLRNGIFNPLTQETAQKIRDWLAEGAPADKEAEIVAVKEDLLAPANGNGKINGKTPPTAGQYPHTQAGLVKIAEEIYGLTLEQTKEALTGAGITGFDAERWSEMVEVVELHSQTVKPVV